jgi:hypothetical protein
VMEYASGGALVGQDQLTREHHMPEPMAQYYFKHIVAGLAYLHKNHVVGGPGARVQAEGGGVVPCGVVWCGVVCLSTHAYWGGHGRVKEVGSMQLAALAGIVGEHPNSS